MPSPHSSMYLSPDFPGSASMSGRPAPDPVALALEPKVVFGHFASLMSIPRDSGAEGAVTQFIQDWARQHNALIRQDSAGNFVAMFPGKGRGEFAPPVILQAHMDMVCNAAKGISINFATDPIRGIIAPRQFFGVEKPALTAEGTTLGADNGIGLAMAMAIVDDPAMTNRPPLHLLCTVKEELGLLGAMELDPRLLEADQLINLDSEEGNEIYVSCAGSTNLYMRFEQPRQAAPPEGLVPVQVSIGGLPGGHSGLKIHEERGNAIQMLGAVMLDAISEFGFQHTPLTSFTGGEKRNAIANTAQCTVWVPEDNAQAFCDFIRSQGLTGAAASESLQGLRENYHAAISLNAAQVAPDSVALPFEGLSMRLVSTKLLLIPQGPIAMSQEVEGLVETSNNLSTITTGDGSIELMCMARSNRVGGLSHLMKEIAGELGAAPGMRVWSEGETPVWEPELSSELLAMTRNALEEAYGAPPKVGAVHAGLECGVIRSKRPSISAVSIGPVITGAHEPVEAVEIESVGKVYEALKLLVSKLAERVHPN